MADALATLVAKQAITEMLYRYCHAIDRNDRALLRTVWHADGVADYGNFFKGPAEAFVGKVIESHAPASALSHQVTNILIDVDGDGATSVTYATALIRTPGNDVVARTVYRDRWSCRDSVWAIDERRVDEPILQVLPNQVA